MECLLKLADSKTFEDESDWNEIEKSITNCYDWFYQS